MRLKIRARGGALPLIALAVACSDDTLPTGTPAPEIAASRVSAPAPSPLVPVTIPGGSIEMWAYTDSDLDGTPSDPINLIFVGTGDAINVRSALMSLDGSRAGPLAPFTCTWTDAIGGSQAAYTSDVGWTGSVIQLECGAYVPFRFHVRLFPAGGGVTIANAHVDVLIPGTEQHQVISWELAEQLVTYDLARSGLLAAAPASTGMINAAPTFREIPAIIYNGLPLELRALTGGPLFGDVQSGVGIQTDGSATVFTLIAAPPAAGSTQQIDITFGQVIPKPFCNSTGIFIRVDGPVTLRQDVRVSGGTLTSRTFAEADLTIRPIDPGTGQPGDPMPGVVRDHTTVQASDHSSIVHNTRRQQLHDGRAPQQLFQELRVGSGGPAAYRSEERCR